MQNVRAVDYYGVDFMNALNSRRIPKSALPRFATGGLVLAKNNANMFAQITSGSANVQELAKRIQAEFNKQKGKTFASQMSAARKWKKLYPDFISISNRGYKFDIIGLAKSLIANAGTSSLDEISKSVANSSASKVDRNVNLNFNIGKGQNYSVLSDLETANALERYFKGLGV